MFYSGKTMPIIRKFGGKRLPKDHKWEDTWYKFPSSSEAAQAAWEIHEHTGLQCSAVGAVLKIYR